MERRRFPRVQVRLPAVYRSAHKTMDTFVCNLSQGGLAITSPEVDSTGTECQVSVFLPGSDTRLELQGRIIWVDITDEPIMGFCFDDLSREQRAALANFLLARLYTP
jgi:hypothetical protein